MALTTVTKIVGLDSTTYYPVTADTASSYTCGTGITIVGSKNLKLTLKVDGKELTGDNIILDYWSKVIGADFELTYAKQDLALLAASLGCDLVAAGTTPNQKQTLSILDDNQAASFQLQGYITGTDTDNAVKSARLVLMKCKINASELLSAVERDAASFTLKGSCMFTTKTFSRNSKTKRLLLDLIMAETAETVAAITS